MTKKHFWLAKVISKDGGQAICLQESGTKIIASMIGSMQVNEIVAIYHDFDDLDVPAYDFEVKAIKYLGEVVNG